MKSEAAGVGPALLWSPEIFGRNVPIIVKWLHDFHAENRLEGDHVMGSFVLSFWPLNLPRRERIKRRI